MSTGGVVFHIQDCRGGLTPACRLRLHARNGQGCTEIEAVPEPSNVQPRESSGSNIVVSETHTWYITTCPNIRQRGVGFSELVKSYLVYDIQNGDLPVADGFILHMST